MNTDETVVVEETTETKVGKKQIVVNVSEEQKEAIQVLKNTYNVTDKGVVAVLLTLAAQAGESISKVVADLGVAKAPAKEKIVLTEEQKIANAEARKRERLAKKIEAARAELEALEAQEQGVEATVEG